MTQPIRIDGVALKMSVADGPMSTAVKLHRAAIVLGVSGRISPQELRDMASDMLAIAAHLDHSPVRKV